MSGDEVGDICYSDGVCSSKKAGQLIYLFGIANQNAAHKQLPGETAAKHILGRFVSHIEKLILGEVMHAKHI